MKHLETERKFLVDKILWQEVRKPAGIPVRQGYLCADEMKVVRVRVAGERGILTVKLNGEGLSRPEYEYLIPVEEALELIGCCSGKVEKIRIRIPAGDHVWEVDEFLGENEGLLMAEIELDDPGELFERPAWLGDEVTGDPRYYNAYLAVNPFIMW